MIKISSPFSWNQYFNQEKFFTVHLYTKSLEDQTTRISSFHSKLLGSLQNNIKRLNDDSNRSSQYDIILDEEFDETCVFDFLELLKTGNIYLKSEKETENINFLLSVFGLTSSMDLDEEIYQYEDPNVFGVVPKNIPESNDEVIGTEELEGLLETIKDEPNQQAILQTQTPVKVKQKSKNVEISDKIIIKPKTILTEKETKQKTIDVASSNFKETRDFLVETLQISSRDLKCKLCRRPFQQTYQMVKHITDIHGYSKNMNETAQNLWLSFQEKQSSAGKKETRCNFCQEVKQDTYAMRQHLSIQHFQQSIRMAGRSDEQSELKCKRCNKKWRTKVRWLEHFLSTHVNVNNLLTE